MLAAIVGSVLAVQQPAFAQTWKPNTPTDILSSDVVRAWIELGASGRLHDLAAVRQVFPDLRWEEFSDTVGPDGRTVFLRGYGADMTGNDAINTFLYTYRTPFARERSHDPNVAGVSFSVRQDRYCFKFGELEARLQSRFPFSEYYSTPWNTSYVLWRAESIITVIGSTTRPPNSCVESLGIYSMKIP